MGSGDFGAQGVGARVIAAEMERKFFLEGVAFGSSVGEGGLEGL